MKISELRRRLQQRAFRQTLEQMGELDGGRGAVEDFERIVGEYGSIEEARHDPRYLEALSRFGDYYFAVKEGREPHRIPYSIGQHRVPGSRPPRKIPPEDLAALKALEEDDVPIETGGVGVPLRRTTPTREPEPVEEPPEEPPSVPDEAWPSLEGVLQPASQEENGWRGERSRWRW
jgi:hypothetical protein